MRKLVRDIASDYSRHCLQHIKNVINKYCYKGTPKVMYGRSRFAEPPVVPSVSPNKAAEQRTPARGQGLQQLRASSGQTRDAVEQQREAYAAELAAQVAVKKARQVGN